MLKSTASIIVLGFSGVWLCSCSTLPPAELAVGVVSDANKHAIVYSLPQTVVVATVPIKQTKHKKSFYLPGKAAEWPDYAQMLGHAGIAPSKIEFFDVTTFALQTDDLALTTRVVADPDHTYIVPLHAGWFEELNVEFEFGERGVIESSSLEVKDRSFDTAVGLAEIALKASTLTVMEKMTAGVSLPPADAASAVDSWREYVPRRLAHIAKLKSKREELLLGFPSDGAAQQALIAEISAQIATEISVLTGTSVDTVWVARFPSTPSERGKTAVQDQALFTFHPMGGIKDLAPIEPGKPAPSWTWNDSYAKTIGEFDAQMNEAIAAVASADASLGLSKPRLKRFFEDQRKALASPTDPISVIYLRCLPDSTQVFSGMKNADNQTDSNSGSLYYRLPATGTAQILCVTGTDKPPLFSSQLSIAQFGPLRQLPRRLGGVGGKITAKFDPDTGVLRTLSANATPPDIKGAISTVSAPLIAAQEKKAAAAKAAQDAATAAGDELAVLQRQFSILDLQNKIKALQTASDAAPTTP